MCHAVAAVVLILAPWRVWPPLPRAQAEARRDRLRSQRRISELEQELEKFLPPPPPPPGALSTALVPLDEAAAESDEGG